MTEEIKVKKKTGNKPLQPTDEERLKVKQMSKFGVPQEQIATVVCGGIKHDTLRKYFRKEIDEGRAEASEGVGGTLYKKAISGDTSAMIWWTKSQMRWRGESLDISNKDGSMKPEVIERVIVKEDNDKS